MTQDALARAAEIGRVTLVRLENGEQPPRFKTLKAVADALGVDAPDLLVQPEFWPGNQVEVSVEGDQPKAMVVTGRKLTAAVGDLRLPKEGGPTAYANSVSAVSIITVVTVDDVLFPFDKGEPAAAAG